MKIEVTEEMRRVLDLYAEAHATWKKHGVGSVRGIAALETKQRVEIEMMSLVSAAVEGAGREAE